MLCLLVWFVAGTVADILFSPVNASTSMTSSAFDSSISPTQNQSSPFSISDILSKEKIGQKRLSPTSSYSIPFSTPGSNGVSKTPMPPMFGQENANRIKSGGSTETPKRPRKSSSSHIPARHPKISLSEAGTMVISSSAQTYAGMQLFPG